MRTTTSASMEEGARQKESRQQFFIIAKAIPISSFPIPTGVETFTSISGLEGGRGVGFVIRVRYFRPLCDIGLVSQRGWGGGEDVCPITLSSRADKIFQKYGLSSCICDEGKLRTCKKVENRWYELVGSRASKVSDERKQNDAIMTGGGSSRTREGKQHKKKYQ